MNVLIKIIFFIFLLSSSITFSQNKSNFIDSLGRKQGAWEEVFDSVQLKKTTSLYIEKANYFNDTLHGNYSMLENGKITYEAEYFKGKLVGYERFYNLNGTLKRIVHRQDGMIDFDLKLYTKGYTKEEVYFEKGLRSSKREYHSNGRVRLISYYTNNILHGNEYYFKKNGKPLMTIEYDHGKVIRVLK